MDAASSQPGDLALPIALAPSPNEAIPHLLVDDLWQSSGCADLALTREELTRAITAIGLRHNFGLPPSIAPDTAHKTAFLRSLHMPELALAQACALGREPAWQRFVTLYRAQLTQAAIAIAGSATVGHELADSLYAELYGLRETNGERRSPLATYSGRGSFLGWLRTTLAQRHIDHHRRTHRESPIDDLNPAAPAPSPIPANLAPLTSALARTLQSLPPEDRFLLATYYLDRQTLLQIARLLRVHEATISRRLKRLTESLRLALLGNLQSGGLSRRAAEETLGTDPRDLEINLRALLQTSQSRPFSDQPEAP